MKPTQSIGQLAVMALSLSPLAAAWPHSWPAWLPDLDSIVVRRADPPSPTNSSSSAAPSPTTTGTNKSQSAKQTNLNTGGIATGNSTSTQAPSHTEYPAQDPAGSVVMVTPAATLQATNLYKIGDFVTWGWNYTNLQGTPTAVDVLVSASTVSHTWTLTQNMTFETAGSYTWDTNSYRQTNIGNPLLTAEYTLIIYDSDTSVSATAEAGYLAPFTGFRFGLYHPKGPTPLSEWQCAACSAALGAMERRALGVAFATSVVTVLSFTWFVVGFGALI